MRGGAKPTVLEHREVVQAADRPVSAFYIALPYGDNERAMRELKPLCEFRDERRFERDGYAISMYRMESRSSAEQ
jgi:hypothetical protein